MHWSRASWRLFTDVLMRETRGVRRGLQPHRWLEQSLQGPPELLGGPWRPVMSSSRLPLRHKDNLDPTLSVPKEGGEQNGVTSENGERFGGVRTGEPGKLRNKFILPITRVKRIFVAPLTHWAFLHPPLGGTAHPLNSTSVLSPSFSRPSPAPLGLHSRTQRHCHNGLQWAERRSCQGPLLLKGHLPSSISNIFQPLHFSIALTIF